MRKIIYNTIEGKPTTSKFHKIYNSFMILTIVVSLIPLCTKSDALWTELIDSITVSIFVIDYLLRLVIADYKFPEKGIKAFFLYPFSIMAIIDLLSILPSLGILSQSFKVMKSVRLFRSLRAIRTIKSVKAVKALKVVRYSKSISVIARVIQDEKESLITVGGFAFGYILIAALIIFNIEPETFNHFFDALYWACVSLTTVGYGDIYPVSTAGRLVTMVSSFVGIAIVALPSGIITAGYMNALHSEETNTSDDNQNDKE